MNSHKKGLRNQRKSKAFILDNYRIYGISEPWRVFITKSSQFGGDMFSRNYIDKNKKIQKAGWDIITLPANIENNVFLIQVKTNKLPDSIYIKTLKEVIVPKYIRKEIHVWEDRNPNPIVIEL